MKEKMKSKILALVGVVALVSLLLPTVVFSAEDTVTCTVSAFLVSVTVTDGSVAYGALEVGTSNNTIALGQTQTVTNTGTVDEDFSISSSNAIGASQNWTLGASAGANVFTHSASIDSGSTWPITMTVAGAYYTLKNGVTNGGNQTFDLQIGMPTSTTDYLEHTITVTVLAEAA